MLREFLLQRSVHLHPKNCDLALEMFVLEHDAVLATEVLAGFDLKCTSCMNLNLKYFIQRRLPLPSSLKHLTPPAESPPFLLLPYRLGIVKTPKIYRCEHIGRRRTRS